MPIIGQTIADVQMFIPTPAESINLNTLITAPYNYWYDENGDGQGSDGVTASGSLSLNIIDEYGNILYRNEPIDDCTGSRYYKVTLTSTNGELKTAYGYPSSTQYDAATATYYLKPKPKPNVVPTACYAQPNLAYSSHYAGFNETTNWDGPVEQWNSKKGFFLQDIHNPSINFPTMGAHGLFFNLIIANPKGAISYSKEPSTSGIGLDLQTVASNNIKVMLTGPRHGASQSVADSFIPTTFTLKSGNTPIYSFRITKWFIGSGNYMNVYDTNYCRNTYGNNYRVPNTDEYSNANGFTWWNGLAGQPDNYQRRIGGGLFAEWGNTCTSQQFMTDCTKISIYKDTDFGEPYF